MTYTVSSGTLNSIPYHTIPLYSELTFFCLSNREDRSGLFRLEKIQMQSVDALQLLRGPRPSAEEHRYSYSLSTGPDPSQFGSIGGLGPILAARSDSDEKAFIALYHNTICTSAHSKHTVWGDYQYWCLLRYRFWGPSRVCVARWPSG